MPRCFGFFSWIRGIWQSLVPGAFAHSSLDSGDSGVVVYESDSEDEPTAPTQTEVQSLDWWQRDTAPEPSAAVLALAGSLRRGASGPTDISVAYIRGRQAAAIRRGELGAFHGPRCTLRNRYYIVLSTGRSSEPFYTRDYSVYHAAVKYPNGNFDVQSISHGFAAEAEVRAFCLGAGLESLPRFQ